MSYYTERSVRELLLEVWDMAQMRVGANFATADELRLGDKTSVILNEAVEEIEGRTERLQKKNYVQETYIERLGAEIDRLHDERPAYPGAWVGRIEELEGRNRNQRETIEVQDEEIDELENANRVLRERVHELVDESNSQFDEISETAVRLREMADSLDGGPPRP